MLLLVIRLFQLNNATTWLGDAGSDLLGDDDGVEDQEAHIGCERSQDHSHQHQDLKQHGWSQLPMSSLFVFVIPLPF